MRTNGSISAAMRSGGCGEIASVAGMVTLVLFQGGLKSDFVN